MKKNESHPSHKLPRGLRNNNPLNIRKGNSLWQGVRKDGNDPEFLQFVSRAWGYRAAFVLLRTYICRHGVCTPQGIIERWAPAADGNQPHEYLNRVLLLSGLKADEKLNSTNRQQMTALVEAMSRVENGVTAVKEEVAEGWALYMG